MYSPEMLKIITDAPWENVQALYQASPTRAAAVTSAYKEAQAKELEARARKESAAAKNLEGGGDQGWKIFSTPTGQMVRVASKGAEAGKPQIQGEDGTWSESAYMPPGSRPVGAKDTGAQVGAGALEDQTIADMNAYARVNGRPLQITGLGNGTAATAAKIRILNQWSRNLKERGIAAEDAGSDAALRDANKPALQALTKQDATIRAGISNVSAVFDKLIKDVAELGGPDSPKLRNIWNKAATEWAGDPTGRLPEGM